MQNNFPTAAQLRYIANYSGKESDRLLVVDAPQKVEISEKFDACLLIDTLKSANDLKIIIKKVHSLLESDGTLLLLAPAKHFDFESLQNILNQTGFREVYMWFAEDNWHALAKAKPLTAPKLSIVVPVFNEVKTFPELMRRLSKKEIPGLEKEIIIVESNSTDGTRQEVLKWQNHPEIEIVLEEKPKGKGAAVRQGLRHASGDFIMIQDGDLEYDVDDYDQLLIPLLNYEQAFVLGSRHVKGKKMRHFETQPIVSFIMNVGQIFFATLLNMFCGQKLKDPFTMYKVFRRDCLFGLTLKANRFDFDFELVIKLLRKGYVPIEIPINYKSRSFGEGKKVSMFRDPLTWLVALFKFRFEKLYQKKYEKEC